MWHRVSSYLIQDIKNKQRISNVPTVCVLRHFICSDFGQLTNTCMSVLRQTETSVNNSMSTTYFSQCIAKTWQYWGDGVEI